MEVRKEPMAHLFARRDETDTFEGQKVSRHVRESRCRSKDLDAPGTSSLRGPGAASFRLSGACSTVGVGVGDGSL